MVHLTGYRRTRARLAAGLLLAAAARGVIAAPQQPSPALTFRSSVDLVAVGVQIIDRDGQPIAGLKTDDFEVWINGRPRRVASVDLVTYPISLANRPPVSSLNPTVLPEIPADVTGRVIVLAVDEASLSLASARQAMNAAKQFVKKLEPEDVVGVFAFPFGAARVDLQHDHVAVGLKLDRVTGRHFKSPGSFSLSVSEVIDITSGDTKAFDAVAERECPVWMDAFARQACVQGLHLEAFTNAAYCETQYTQSLGDLRALLEGLGTIPGRKTVVLVSGGMVVPDRVGGHPDVNAMLKAAVAEASASDVSLYALHIDTTFAEAYSPSAKSAFDASARFATLGRDRFAEATGLERLAGEAGGALFQDQVGAGERAFARILRETSAYYLLGVESLDADRDGRVHYIRVKAKAKNATVRARTQVVIPRARR